MSDRIKLYIDEDAQRTDLITALRARQIELLTVSETQKIGEPDQIQLEYAAANGLVLLTFNRGDFFQLHRDWLIAGKSHSGIIVSDQLRTGTLLRRLLKLIDSKSAQEMQNWFEFLSNWK